MMTERVYSCSQAAEILDFSEEVLRSAVMSGRAPADWHDLKDPHDGFHFTEPQLGQWKVAIARSRPPSARDPDYFEAPWSTP